MLIYISLTSAICLLQCNANGRRIAIFINMIGESANMDIELTWKGKAKAIEEATTPTSARLQAHPEMSLLGHEDNHLFIEGDNLTGLKILAKDYTNQISQIYIDPPYNTGRQFVYKDHFKSHAAWLNMMYPRLILARQLLKDSGTIFISIDDHELAHLKMIMDEIFGEDNYIDTFSWVKSATPANLSKKSKKVIEYILCYQKIKDDVKFNGIKKHSPSTNGLLNQMNKKKALQFPANVVRTSLSDRTIKAGAYGTPRYEIELLKNTSIKNGIFIKPVVLKAKFKWTQAKLDKEIADGTEIFISTSKLSPSYDKKSYAPEVPPNLIDHRVGVSTNEVATKNLIQLMGAKVFDFPKPVSLIKYLLGFNDDPEGIILDFFAGSGATAHAVIEMNMDDNGKRKCIVIQLDEKVAKESVADARGYKTISQISIDRIQRFIQSAHPLGHPPRMGLEVFSINHPIESSCEQ